MKFKEIKDFFRNYRKILIGALICLVVFLVVSAVIFISGLKSEIKNENNAQLELMEEKSILLTEYLDSASQKFIERCMGYADVVGRFLVLAPEDANQKEVLDRYCKSLSSLRNLQLVDFERRSFYSYGNVRNVDYTDSYYDDLFLIASDELEWMYEKDSDCLLSAVKRIGNGYVVLQMDVSNSLFQPCDQEKKWKLIVDSVGCDSISEVVVVNKDDRQVVYSTKPEWADGSFDINNIKGIRSVQTKDIEELGTIIYVVTEQSVIFKEALSNFFLVLILFLAGTFVLLAYVYCLRQDKIDPVGEYRACGKYFLKKQVRSFRVFAVFISVAIGIIFLIVSNLTKNSSIYEFLKNETEKGIEAIDNQNTILSFTEKNRSMIFSDFGNLAGEFLKEHEEYQTKAGLGQVAEVLDVKYVTLFDADGNTKSTSSPLDNVNILIDPESTLYELRYVLQGKEKMTVEADATIMQEDELIYAVPNRTREGVANGIVALTTTNGLRNKDADLLQEKNSNFIEYKRAKEGSSLFVVDSYGVIVVNEDQELVGILVNELGIDDSTLENGFSGNIVIDEKNYMAVVSRSEETNNYIYAIAPIDWFDSSSLWRSLLCTLLFFILSFWICFDGLGSKYHFVERKQKTKDADDNDRTELTWEELSISKKMGKILSVGVYIFSVFLVILKICQTKGIADSDGFGFFVSTSWKHSINGYSVLGNLCVVCVFFTGIRLVEGILNTIEKSGSGGMATTCRLISNLVKYIGGIACLFIVITNFGVDMKTALASVGIVGLGLTLGAQELIKDLIAGMFILFEGNYKVGDMLLIDGEWFWVTSIGVRTTKVEAWGSVRVINNSQMTGIVNIQNSSASVNVDVLIGNEYDLDEIERILNEELPHLKEQYPPETAEILITAGEPRVRAIIFSKVKESGYHLPNLFHKMTDIIEMPELTAPAFLFAFTLLTRQMVFRHLPMRFL